MVNKLKPTIIPYKNKYKNPADTSVVYDSAGDPSQFIKPFNLSYLFFWKGPFAMLGTLLRPSSTSGVDVHGATENKCMCVR